MRKIIILILIGILVQGAYFYSDDAKATFNKYLYYSVCDKPLGYSIGEIDQRFGLTREQFQNIADDASSDWNMAYGKNLLTYDPKAQLSINLIFDERQSQLNDVQSIKSQVDENKEKLTPSIEEYEKLKEEFKKKQNELNEKILFWNNQGGAPEDEFNKLISEQDVLKEEAKKLNEMAKGLNKSTAEYNEKVQTLNKAAQVYNSTVDEKPEGGIYDPAKDKIELYYGSDKNKLKRILTHEMGHALGMGHSRSETDIMYYQFTGKQSEISKEDINILSAICKPKNRLVILRETMAERLNLLYKLYFQK